MSILWKDSRPILVTSREECKNVQQVVRDKATAYKTDESLYPCPTKGYHGNPYYFNHPAKTSLADGIKQSAYNGMTLLQVQATRRVDQDFNPYAFRNHMYREQWRQHEKTGWQHGQNKSGYKQHKADYQIARLRNEE